MFLPIQHENQNGRKIKEKQKCMWEQLHSRMDQRQKEWKTEMEELKKNFFRDFSLSSSTTTTAAASSNQNASLGSRSLSPGVLSPSPPPLNAPFYHEFDVKSFQPEEISVRTRNNKLLLEASHKELNSNKSVSREFKRELDIPASVDPQSLRCSFTEDGRLVIAEEQVPPSFTFHERSIVSSSPDRGNASVGREWASPLPDVVDNRFTSSDARETIPQKRFGSFGEAAPDGMTKSLQTLEENIKSVHCSRRPFRVDIDLGRVVEPTQLKIDAIDKTLLVRVFMYNSLGHTRAWKVHLPPSLDPSEVAAHLTDGGELILEENREVLTGSEHS